MSDLAPGTVIAGCRVDAVAGRGGMGVVYRATELGLGRPVALKLIAAELAADDGFRARFAREARLTAGIDHPNVIPVYAAGEEDGRLYLTMRYVAGTDLAARLAAGGPLEPGLAVEIVGQVAAALDAAHETGLVHRDVKPANVLIGGSGHVYLSDFGIVRAPAAEGRLTDSGEWIGTVDFMAPEQLRGEGTDARTDVYGLGGVLYAALTGLVPFPRDTAPATMLAHMTEAPPRPSSRAAVPAALDEVVARAMAKDPAARYGSAGELARGAQAAVAGTGAAVPGHAAAQVPPGDGEALTVHVDRAEAPTALAPREPSQAATAHAPVAAGTALRPDPAIAPGGPRATRAPKERRPAPRATRTPSRRIAVAAATAALAAAVAVAALSGAFDPSPRSGGPVSAGQVGGVVGAFARAYGREDLRALGRTLSPGVQRVAPGSRQRGRAEVLSEYARQFSASAVRGYRISGLSVSGGAVGRAAGRYAVPRANGGPITGRIVFGVAKIGGRARIALIALEPAG